MRPRILASLALAGALVAAACSADTDGTADDPAAPSAGEGVEVGFYLIDNQAAALSGAGVEAAEGDPKEVLDALVDDLNDRGGLDGHPVTPVYAYFDATSAQTVDEMAQAACATFFDDHDVVAVIALATLDAPLADCTTEHKVPAATQLGLMTSSRLEESPYIVLLNHLTLDHLVGPYVDGLAAQGFFGDDAKVGLLYFDYPGEAELVDDVVAPALADHDLEVDARFGFSPLQRMSDTSAYGAQASNAVLQFKSAGVTHVLALDRSGAGTLLFSLVAATQDYRPALGLTTNSAPGLLKANVPPAQLAGARGVGWLPQADVDVSDLPDFDDADRSCLDTLEARDVASDDRKTQEAILGLCDAVALVEEATAAGGGLGGDAFLDGLDALGDTFAARQPFAYSWSRDRREGPAEVADFAYAADCGCFRYTGGPRPVG